MINFNQKGAAPLLILVAIIGVIAFFAVTSNAPFTNKLMTALYPKPASNASTSFLETFDESPKNPDGTFAATPPVPWTQSSWAKRFDVNVLDTGAGVGDTNDWEMLEPVTLAHHGPDCSPPFNTHTSSTVYDNVYGCRGHIMTTILSGYATVFLTPNAMADFSQGESVISWDVSTFQSTGRDWWSLTVTPWEDNLAIPQSVCCNGEGKRGVLMTMDGENMKVSKIINHEQQETTWGGGLSEGMSQYFPTKYSNAQQAAASRQTYELRISKTHIKFGMPKLGLVFVDKDITPLDWDKGVVTWTHHAYNPQKGCTPDGTPTGCAPNSWHWDNFSINPAQPFTMLKGDAVGVNKSTSNTVNFQAPAPANSFLRFGATGTIQVSFDNGQTFQPAKKQEAGADSPEHFSSYFTPVPQGATKVMFKGSGDRYIWDWLVRNPAIWSQQTDPNATPFPQPSFSAAPTPVPSPSPTPTPTPVVTPTPVPPSGGLVVTFDDAAGTNTQLNGSYPSGVIDWGTNAWYVSAPWKKLGTKSMSYNGDNQTTGTFALSSPRRLVSIDAYNGGIASATTTISCAGNPNKVVTLAPDQLMTIQTGWTANCSSITMSSTNGWDTNYDNFVLGPTGSAPSVAPSPSPTPSQTPVPSSGGGETTITFNDHPLSNKPMSGQYPSGVIDWGTNKWYISSPWQLFKTKSFSYNGGSIKTASFNFVTPKTLTKLDLYNGGSGSATTTISCAGNPNKTITINSKQMLTAVATGWTTPCSSVTMSSTNGWDTNYDNLVIK